MYTICYTHNMHCAFCESPSTSTHPYSRVQTHIARRAHKHLACEQHTLYMYAIYIYIAQQYQSPPTCVYTDIQYIYIRKVRPRVTITHAAPPPPTFRAFVRSKCAPPRIQLHRSDIKRSKYVYYIRPSVERISA